MSGFAPLWLATGFLSRLPVPDIEVTPERLGASVRWFAPVGLALGTLLVLASTLLQQTGIGSTPLLQAALLLSLHTWLTGGLHLDGLADTFDGLGAGHRDPEKGLAAMRDSQTGVFGMLAILLIVLVKWNALGVLLAGTSGCAALWLFPVVGRAAASIAVSMFPYARAEGLGRAYHDHSSTPDAGFAIATVVAVLLVLAPGMWLPATLTLVVTWVVADRLCHRFGGLTGDGYGMVIEVAETLLLVGACL